jgi:hypothetical protein
MEQAVKFIVSVLSFATSCVIGILILMIGVKQTSFLSFYLLKHSATPTGLDLIIGVIFLILGISIAIRCFRLIGTNYKRLLVFMLLAVVLWLSDNTLQRQLALYDAGPGGIYAEDTPLVNLLKNTTWEETNTEDKHTLYFGSQVVNAENNTYTFVDSLNTKATGWRLPVGKKVLHIKTTDMTNLYDIVIITETELALTNRGDNTFTRYTRIK